MIVNLTPSDIEICRKAALRRTEERLRAGAIEKSNFDFHLKCHNIGALGEHTVCKHYSCEWLGEYFEGKDWDNRTWDTAVGEVRATFRPDKYGGMRLYPGDDRPEAPYVWVNLRKLGTSIVQAKIVGWAYQSDKKDKWWNPDAGKNGAWVIPKEKLRSMDTLPSI